MITLASKYRSNHFDLLYVATSEITNSAWNITIYWTASLGISNISPLGITHKCLILSTTTLVSHRNFSFQKMNSKTRYSHPIILPPITRNSIITKSSYRDLSLLRRISSQTFVKNRSKRHCSPSENTPNLKFAN